MMRKNVVLLAMIMAGFSGGAMAATETGGWYTGVKAGWSDYYNADIGHHVSHDSTATSQVGIRGDNGAGGVLLGYQATDWLALEGGYDYLGNMRISSNNSTGANMANQGLQLSVKLGVPVTDSWALYARMGGMGWQAKTKNAGRTAHDAGISPLAALGTELAFNDDWAMRLEYQYVSNIGEGGDSGITVDNGQTSLGLIYHFGATVRPEPQPVQAAAPPVARPVTQTFNLRSDVLFAHNSAVLMPAGHEAVVKLYRALQQQASTTGHILVKGYTDRTGRPDYNQALSTRRAQAVADVLIEQGISAAAIAVQGEGSQAPVTGSNCDAVKARGALIDCLAPDRRVEVEVTGEKTASASVATPATVPVVDPALEMHF